MKKVLKTPIVRYIVLGILAAILGMNVFSLNASRLAGNAVPMPFGFGASVVLSGSMEPAPSVGDLLIVQAQEDYETGDIVVYQSGSVPVVHRIVRRPSAAPPQSTRATAGSAAPLPICPSRRTPWGCL